MLISLKLKNFKKHEDLTISFTEGLNVIRGSNENGKSTVVQAVAYALYGARALPLSLDETVTWGKPVSSLKVELVFQHDGEMYTLTRSKSGAELVGTTAKSSGQTEVTAFIERLFGASAAIGQATMLTNQSALQAGLDSASLIEKLANMSLIDELIGKVQAQLPTGSTKLLESQLGSLLEAVKPSEPALELQEDITEATINAAAAKEWVEQNKVVVARWKPLADSAKRKRDKNAESGVRAAEILAELAALPKELVLQPEQDIVELEQAQAKQNEYKDKLQAWETFQRIPHQDQHYGSASEFLEEFRSVEQIITTLNSDKQVALVTLAGLKPLLITESACGLCGKDLSEVPEVVEKNKTTQSKIEETEQKIEDIAKQLVQLSDTKRKLLSFEKMFDAVEKYVGTAYTEFDLTAVPPKATWVGGLVDSQVDNNDYKKLILKAKLNKELNEKARQAFEVAATKREMLLKQLDALAELELTEDEAQAQKELANVEAELKAAEANFKQLDKAVSDAEAALKQAQAVYKAQLKAWEDIQARRKELEYGIEQQQRHNSLIKKLREAKPAVSKQLWTVVLSAVSHYFSSVRGVQSVVTREGTGFAIDGKVLDAYSGSTKDALALAVRVVLQKTFLPNIDFAIFDEVASACDDSRESEMLAMLSTCGLKQVLLVTHSDLADSYAANVIRI